MKKWVLILILVNLTGIFLGAQDPYLEGIARLNEGDFLKAEQSFGEALEIRSTNPDLYLMKAEIFYLRGDFLKSIAWADKANELSEGKGDYLVARSWSMSGNATEAVIYLERHMNSAFKLPRHEILLDPAFSGIEDSESWKAFWKDTWYSENEDFEFEVVYLRKSGDYIEALEKINEGLAVRPRWGELIAEKGHTLYMMKNYQDAVRAWSAAVEISPDNPDNYLGRARAYRELGKYQEGIRDMEHVSRKKPEKLDLLKELSLLCKSGKQYRDAAEYIKQYLLYFPLSAEAHYIQGSIYTDAEQILKALSSLNTCLGLDPGKAKYFIARGNAYLNSDTWTYAIKDFSMALDLDPRNPETWYLKGICRLKKGEQEGAKSDFEIAASYGSFQASEMLERMDR